jgi:dienelactone hydrolase
VATREHLEKFHFSPSLYHQALQKNLSPALAYNGQDLKSWQRTLRKKIKELIGLPTNPKGDLRVRSLWKRNHALGTIEKIAFTSEPYVDVPAYVCLPAKGSPPYPFMICLQGHSTGMHNSIAVTFDDESKEMAVSGDRDFAMGCMQRGFGALCIEQRSFGLRQERLQKQRSTTSYCHEAAMHSLMLGRTLIGERVYDVDRGIDYLMSRDDVDTNRIGVMGNSGGGTVSIYASALLPRIQFAMPSCAFGSFRDTIMAIYHCECNYIPGILKWADMSDIAGLFAPRPMVIVSGKNDEIFPIKSARSQFSKLKEIYRAAGAEEQCKLVVGPEDHRFYANQGWSALLKLID